jgi:hypothetical protein
MAIEAMESERNRANREKSSEVESLNSFDALDFARLPSISLGISHEHAQ